MSYHSRRSFLQFLGAGVGLAAFPSLQSVVAQAPRSSDPIRVGILFSLSGTMAISEVATLQATQLAIEEINRAGGVLGRQIEPIIEDGASDWPTFSEKAKSLVDQQVATVFGCWTSASRKACLPVFETRNHQLWYPVNYEGQECSRNIFYTGALPNQQVEPAIAWLKTTFKQRPFFLVGSDYVFPRTVNHIAKRRGITVVGEEYIPLGYTEVRSLIQTIRSAMPRGGIIFNSFNGDTNVAFFKELQAQGMSPKRYPVLSLSIAEEEILAIGTDYLEGHYVSWSYFQSVNTAANRRFVAAFKAKYGNERLVNDPMQSAYNSVYLWKQAVEKAGTVEDLAKVRQAARGSTLTAPEGRITLHNNHHVSRFARIGRIRSDGQLAIVYQSKTPIQPQPWNQNVPETRGYACDWSDSRKGGKYRIK